MSLGAPEILVILLVALLVFGPTRLPEVGRQVGRGVRELRKFQQSLQTDLEDVLVDDVSDSTEMAPTLPPKEDAVALPDGTEGVPTVDAPAGEAPGGPAEQAVPPVPPDPE